MAVKTKAAILAEIASLFADNTSGLISASDLRTVTNDITDSYFDAPYKKYVSKISQLGTAAPTITIFENTLSGTPVWSRVGVGNYAMTLSGEFVSGVWIAPFGDQLGAGIGKIPIMNVTGGSVIGYYTMYAGSDSVITLAVTDTTGTLVEFSSLLTFQAGLYLPEIRVYV